MTQTNKIIVTEVSHRGALIATNGTTSLVDWHTLRRAADPNYQSDPELLRVYRSVLATADEMVRQQRPVSISAERLSNGLYGVVGIGIDGLERRIAAYRPLRFRADECMDHGTLADARLEAHEIRERNPEAPRA